MSSVTIEKINENIMAIRKELSEIKKYIEEDNMELSDVTKKKIEDSRKRSLSEMKSQEEIEEIHQINYK